MKGSIQTDNQNWMVSESKVRFFGEENKLHRCPICGYEANFNPNSQDLIFPSCPKCLKKWINNNLPKMEEVALPEDLK